MNEPIIIAVVGKGGTGKSAITTLIAKVISTYYDYKLLLIDADPTHPHLSHMVNLVPERSLEDIRLEIIKTSMENKKKLSQIAENVDFKLYNAIKESKKFSVLSIGKPEAPGCFCPANSLLRTVIESISKDFEIILIDCEAGLEQINRKVIRSVDIILIVSDISIRSLETANSIKKSAEKFTHYKRIELILNKVRGNIDSFLESIEKTDIPLIGKVPDDEIILDFDMEGKPLIHIPDESNVLISIKKIVEKIL
jgi:CO dehydrogenase maturation factor